MRRHLTVEQRYAIFSLLQTGISQKDIARVIGVNKSTISRKLRRNCNYRSGQYAMDLAQRKADKRQREKRRRCSFTEQVKEQVKEMLGKKLSPEQIAGRSKLKDDVMVSHETIYRWIWDDREAGRDMHTHLRRQGRKYRHRGTAKDSRGIIPNIPAGGDCG